MVAEKGCGVNEPSSNLERKNEKNLGDPKLDESEPLFGVEKELGLNKRHVDA